MQLHLGEASIIALAKELYDQGNENILIIDDLTARQIARTLNLKVTGTLGIIIKALRINLINKNESKEFVRILVEETSFRISVKLYIDIIKEIDKL
jgi:predicted nucleic acid-binding protein